MAKLVVSFSTFNLCGERVDFFTFSVECVSEYVSKHGFKTFTLEEPSAPELLVLLAEDEHFTRFYCTSSGRSRAFEFSPQCTSHNCEGYIFLVIKWQALAT